MIVKLVAGSVAALVGIGACSSNEERAVCTSVFDEGAVTLAVGHRLASSEESTWCVRWTAPEDLSLVGFTGIIGVTGHHALLYVDPSPSHPDGVTPCDDVDGMSQDELARIRFLAGLSYETEGQSFLFPQQPVAVGFRVAAGQQLVLQGHFLNASDTAQDACASIELARGDVTIELEFMTVLPADEYDLAIPAGQQVDVTYRAPVGGHYRIGAAGVHMHAGALGATFSIEQTGEVLHQVDDWQGLSVTPQSGFGSEVTADQTFMLACSFENPGATEVRFPEQMCVGVLYIVDCATQPFACSGARSP